MSITNYTNLELKLQAEVAELKAELEQLVQNVEQRGAHWFDRFEVVADKLYDVEKERDAFKAKLAETEQARALIMQKLANTVVERDTLKAKRAVVEKRLHMLFMPVPAKNVTALDICKAVSEQAMEIIKLLKGQP